MKYIRLKCGNRCWAKWKRSNYSGKRVLIYVFSNLTAGFGLSVRNGVLPPVNTPSHLLRCPMWPSHSCQCPWYSSPSSHRWGTVHNMHNIGDVIVGFFFLNQWSIDLLYVNAKLLHLWVNTLQWKKKNENNCDFRIILPGTFNCNDGSKWWTCFYNAPVMRLKTLHKQ